MKFGVRECCDVVLRAKAAQKIGNKIFYKNEPVCYFDTLKTSTLEGAATTVYAQGGRGNARLMSWDGERTVTFTMEDALISPIGLAILTGAGLIEATAGDPIIQHVTETVTADKLNFTNNTIELSQAPYQHDDDLNIYIMGLDSHGEVATEPFLGIVDDTNTIYVKAEVNYKSLDYTPGQTENDPAIWKFLPSEEENVTGTGYYTYDDTDDEYDAVASGATFDPEETYYTEVKASLDDKKQPNESRIIKIAQNTHYSVDGRGVKYFDNITNKTLTNLDFKKYDKFLVDYYIARRSGAFQVDITPDKFGGSFYLEASTLWRDQGTGQDLPAEFIIPNCRVQSNFTFTMASSGDPSSFTFTMDAFPDYTRYDADEKVLARIQVIGATDEGLVDIHRTETWSLDGGNELFGGTDRKNIQENTATAATTETTFTSGG